MSLNDPYVWLEALDSQRAQNWVRAANANTIDELTSDARFNAIQKRLLKIYDSTEKIAYANKGGDYYYNFWRDAHHERGIWRRSTWESYLTADPQWDIVLNLDDLSAKENENWVWHGCNFLNPNNTRCLISLSRGGADAHVQREFDIPSRQFVSDGFQLPEAKSSMSWIDHDTVWVGTDFGEETQTNSGYPRLVKRWRRHTPLDAAELVFEGERDNISVHGWHDRTPGFERSFIAQNITFYSHYLFEVVDGALQRIAKPDDAIAIVYRSWIALELRSDWHVNDQTYSSGSLLISDYNEFKQGSATFHVLFKPTAARSLQGWSHCRDHLILNTLEDVRSRIEIRTPSSVGWQHSALAAPTSTYDTVQAIPIDPRDSNALWIEATGFLTPASLGTAEVGSTSRMIKSSPGYFDTTGLGVTQHFATSNDGTQVPYFLVGDASMQGSTPSPTLLYGYGGFELSLLPSYSATIGAAWLEQGGTYAVANIRGGGEYGPNWHQSAMKENRHRAYEDFLAVGQDLVQQGITTPQSLGIMGGSNGGLLMGTMYTQHPTHWGAVVCCVPLLDMRRYHKLLAGASWIAEYGDPDDPDEWAYLRTYSPYHNINPDIDYPPILFTTSTRDDRVHPGHARKMAHALMEAGKNVSYYENMEGGHSGTSNNKQMAFVNALEFQFLWNTLTSS